MSHLAPEYEVDLEAGRCNGASVAASPRSRDLLQELTASYGLGPHLAANRGVTSGTLTCMLSVVSRAMLPPGSAETQLALVSRTRVNFAKGYDGGVHAVQITPECTVIRFLLMLQGDEFVTGELRFER